MNANSMQNAVFLIVLVTTSLFWQTTLAQESNSAASNPLVLTDEEEEYRLGPHLELLEDPSGKLTIDDITSPEIGARFVSSAVDVPNYGFTSSAYWIRLPLRNQSRLFDHWILEIDFAPDFADLYVPIPNGGGFDVRQEGSLRSSQSRAIRHPDIAFDLFIPMASEQVYYLRIASESSMTLPLFLRTHTAFLEHTQNEFAAASLFLGVLLALCIYNAFLFVSVRDKSYLFLAGLLTSLLVFELAYTGFGAMFFPPIAYWLKRYMRPLSIAIFVALQIPFALAFLNLKQQLPRLYWMNITVLAGWGVVIFLLPFTSFVLYAPAALAYGLLSCVIVFATCIVAWARGMVRSQFFMLAWYGMLLAVGVTFMVRLGLVPSMTLTEHTYELGVAWMAICWSVSLADSINVLKSDIAQKELRLSQILESLPVGVVLYQRDRTPSYANKRVFEILSNPARNIQPDLSIRRTLDEAMTYFSFRKQGSDQAYPLEAMPVHRALQGEVATVDDIEADLIDRRVPLEIWASPLLDRLNDVEAAIVVFQDISERNKARAELDAYRLHLEEMVELRTSELSVINEVLNQEATQRKFLAAFQVKLIAWLSLINETQQSLHSIEYLPAAYERLLPKISQLTDAASVLVVIWKEEPDEMNLLACLRQEGTDLVLVRLDEPFDKSSQLHQIIAADKLLIWPSECNRATLAPLMSCLHDPAILSVILAPIKTKQGDPGLLVLGMARSVDSFSDTEIKFFDRIRVDMVGLNDYAYFAETTLELAAAKERNRLAQDLHDSVTQVLFSASLLAEVLPTIWQRDPAQGMESLEGLRRLTRSALAEMRSLLLELRPSSIIKTPLHDLIAQLTEAVLSRTHLSCRLQIQQTPALPADVHVAFYRVAQETLNNVVKHAEANQVTVRLFALPTAASAMDLPDPGVALEIMDDGIGVEQDDQHAGAMGLNIMRERAADVGADFAITSQLGRGTKVTLTWPGSLPSGHGPLPTSPRRGRAGWQPLP